MPKAILITAENHDDELRVYHDETDEGTGIHVYGPTRWSRRYACTFLTDPVRPGEPGFLAELEAAGFDPKSVVFSILKKGAVRQIAGTNTDDAFGEALSSIEDMKKVLLDGGETKGVIVFDEEEVETLREKLAAIEDALGTILAAKTGATVL